MFVRTVYNRRRAAQGRIVSKPRIFDFDGFINRKKQFIVDFCDNVVFEQVKALGYSAAKITYVHVRKSRGFRNDRTLCFCRAPPTKTFDPPMSIARRFSIFLLLSDSCQKIIRTCFSWTFSVFCNKKVKGNKIYSDCALIILLIGCYLRRGVNFRLKIIVVCSFLF